MTLRKILTSLFLIKIYSTIFKVSFYAVLSFIISLVIMAPLLAILWIIWPPAVDIALGFGIIGGIIAGFAKTPNKHTNLTTK